MTIPKISLEVIEATAAVAMRKPMNEYALHSVLDLMQDQPELTQMINTMVGNLINGSNDVDTVSSEFAQNAILTAAYTAYGLAMDSVKAQIETNELNEEWA